MRKALSRLAVLLCLTAALPAARAAESRESVDVTFSLDFMVLGRHSPWYVALGKGFYKDEGLNVTIIPGKGTAQVVQALESGLADFGFCDVPGLILARANGAKSRMVAVNYQKAPYTVFSLDPGANVTTPEGLVGLEIVSGAGSFVPKVIEGFMRHKGLDPKTVKFVHTEPAATVGMLLSRKAPAIDLFIMSKPGLSRAVKDATLRSLLLSDFGLELYANGIAVKEEDLRKRPEVIKAFVRASLRGWQYALAHPEEAADIQLRYAKGLDRDVIIDEIGVLRGLAVTPDTLKHGLGWFDPAKMRSTLEFMLENVPASGKPPKAKDLYDAGFLPEQAILP